MRNLQSAPQIEATPKHLLSSGLGQVHMTNPSAPSTPQHLPE
jgi:hypothetical protein